MNLFQALLLGAVQGVTEFLPISSSAHLILARFLFNIQQDPQAAFDFDILIQMGTWLAVLIYYWSDIRAISLDIFRSLRGEPAPNARLGWLIALATVPAVIVGWLSRNAMSGDASGMLLTGLFLIVNAGLLAMAESIGKRSRKLGDLNILDAVIIGLGQALALLPAVSRSAATIASGMARDLDRRDAARFAFLMSFPIMPAAALVGLVDLGQLPNPSELAMPLIIGFMAATVVGFLSIRWLLGYLANHSFFPFVYYCLVVGGAVSIISLLI